MVRIEKDYVSRAPIEKIERYKAEKGWRFPWYSSHGTDFNYDFDVTMDPAVKPPVYNLRRYWLDLTALGRQEDWEELKGRADSAHTAQPDFVDRRG